MNAFGSRSGGDRQVSCVGYATSCSFTCAGWSGHEPNPPHNVEVDHRPAGRRVGAYTGYVGLTWLRYGHPDVPAADDADPLLDRFMPAYDMTERHHIDIAAPADATFAAACEQDLVALPLARAIFKARAVLLGSERDATIRPHGLVALTKSICWASSRKFRGGSRRRCRNTALACRRCIQDAATARIIEFDEPGYVKIAWTLRADTRGTTTSVFRTETRALATDATARFKFRRYSAFLSPGIILIRRASLKPLRTEAERRRDRSLGHSAAHAAMERP